MVCLLDYPVKPDNDNEHASPMDMKKNNKFVYFLILLAFVSGLFWIVKYYVFDYSPKEGARADKIAKLFLDKGFFNNDFLLDQNIDRTMYPLIISQLYKIFGQHFIVTRLFQLCIFILMVLMVYKLCRLVFDELTARIAGVTTALCYTLAAYINWIYRELFFGFLLVVLVYCLYRAQMTNKKRWFALSGFVCGIALLTNAMLGFFIFAIIGCFVVLNWKRGFLDIFPRLVSFIFVVILVTAPITMHFYTTFNRFIFTAGRGLILPQRVERMYAMDEKYHQHLVGNTLGDFFAYKWFDDYDPRESRLGWESWQRWMDMVNKEGISFSEADRIMTREAVGEIFSHPILYAKVVAIDLLKFNTPMLPDIRIQGMFVNTHNNLSDLTKSSVILFFRFLYLILALVIIYGIMKNVKNWRKIGWALLIVLYFNLVFSNLIAIARYSVPVYPFYIVLFSLGAALIWQRVYKFWLRFSARDVKMCKSNKMKI